MAYKAIRCAEGNASPQTRFWRVINAAESKTGTAEIELYGTISEYSWFEDDITPQMFKDDLYAVGGNGPVVVKINSGGGDVIAASVMRSILREYPGDVITRIEGVAASSAVMIALSGKKIQIQDSAYMMIHDPSYMVMFADLDLNMLQQWIDALKATKQGLVDTYASRTGLSVEKLNRMMSDTTWMSAKQAVELGFADEILTIGQETGGQANLITAQNIRMLKNHVSIPAELENLSVQSDDQTPKKSGDSDASDAVSDDEQALRDEISLYL